MLVGAATVVELVDVVVVDGLDVVVVGSSVGGSDGAGKVVTDVEVDVVVGAVFRGGAVVVVVGAIGAAPGGGLRWEGTGPLVATTAAVAGLEAVGMERAGTGVPA